MGERNERIRMLEEKTRRHLVENDGWRVVEGSHFPGYLFKMTLFPSDKKGVDFICGKIFCSPNGAGGYYIRKVLA